MPPWHGSPLSDVDSPFVFEQYPAEPAHWWAAGESGANNK